MAEFGVEATSISPVGNSVPVTQGVETSPTLLAGASSVLEQVGEVFAGRRESREDQVVSEFLVKQTAVMDALEQGTGGIRNSSQARTIMRRNFIEAVNSNRGLADRLTSTQKSVLGLFGDSSLLQDGTDEEQRRTAVRDSLVNDGLVAPDATEAEFTAAENSMRVAANAKNLFDEQMRTISMRQATANLSEAEAKRLEEQKAAAAMTYIQTSSGTQMASLRGRFDTILNGAGTEAEKQQAIQDIFVGWRSEANALIGQVGTGEFSAFLKPFEELQELYVSRATGELTDQETKRQAERIMATQELIALSDPAVANLAVASSLFSDTVFQNALVQNQGAFNAALRFMSGGAPTSPGSPPGPATDTAPPFVTSSDDKAGMDAYLGSVLRGLDSSDEGTQSEAVSRVQSLLESVEDYEGLIRRNPEAGIALVNWMSKPPFQRAVAAHPEAFGDLSGVQEVLKNHYDNEVWSMVSREFRNNRVEVLTAETREIPRIGGTTFLSGNQIPAGTDSRNIVEHVDNPNLVGARSTSSGVEFIPLVTGNADGAVEARAEARRLNNELAPVINTTIKAAAHLQGRTDYGAMWEESANDFLGGGMTGPENNDEGDDLSLSSFREGSSNLTQALTTGGFVGDGDYTDAETPAEVAAAFVGFQEEEHKNVLSSFIKNAVGTNLDPSKTAWCAAFVNAALGATGREGTGALNARSFLNWGTPVQNPQEGDVVVFSRGDPNGWEGHVGFYVGETEDGRIKVLGGNQGTSGEVSVAIYGRDRLLGYRRGDE